MTPSSLKVLYAIMLLADQGKPITVRSIRDVLGWRSTNHVSTCMKVLRSNGMIAYEPPKFRGTIRPTCRFIPVEQLESTNAD